MTTSASGRLLLLATSPRVAPGLLSAAAWESLRASRVLAGSAGHPQLDALRAADVYVEVIDAVDASSLLDAAAGETVVWLLGPEGDAELVEALTAEARRRSDRDGPTPRVETVAGSHDLPGARLLDLVAVMDRLRSPGGCPWDAEQTHRSLATYLLEETYETLEAIETGSSEHLLEELGDLLLQVVFHARIAEELPAGAWSIDDVAAGIADKLVRRHPHVFGDASAGSASHVADRWEMLKREEKRRQSALDGVPLAQPALSLAAKIAHRAEKAGVDVETPSVTLPELRDTADVGDALFAIVLAARRLDVDPEQALRDAARRFADAVRAAEEAGK